MQLLGHIGDKKPVNLSYLHDNQVVNTSLNLVSWRLDGKDKNFLQTLGIKAALPFIPNRIGKIEKGSPAEVAGLKVGDEITEVNHKKTSDWQEILNSIHQSKGLMDLHVVRDGKMLTFRIHLEEKWQGLKLKPYLGIAPVMVKWPENQLVIQKYPFWPAGYHASQKLLQLFAFNAASIEKLATGKIAISALSGPVGILTGSSQALQSGWLSFLRFTAFISFMLAFINLLPLPGLDGGQLVFLLFETLRGRPLSTAWQLLLIRLSMILLIILVFQATINDILRLIA